MAAMGLKELLWRLEDDNLLFLPYTDRKAYS